METPPSQPQPSQTSTNTHTTVPSIASTSPHQISHITSQDVYNAQEQIVSGNRKVPTWLIVLCTILSFTIIGFISWFSLLAYRGTPLKGRVRDKTQNPSASDVRIQYTATQSVISPTSLPPPPLAASPSVPSNTPKTPTAPHQQQPTVSLVEAFKKPFCQENSINTMRQYAGLMNKQNAVDGATNLNKPVHLHNFEVLVTLIQQPVEEKEEQIFQNNIQQLMNTLNAKHIVNFFAVCWQKLLCPIQKNKEIDSTAAGVSTSAPLEITPEQEVQMNQQDQQRRLEAVQKQLSFAYLSWPFNIVKNRISEIIWGMAQAPDIAELRKFLSTVMPDPNAQNNPLLIELNRVLSSH